MYIVRPITMETLWGDTRLHSYQGDRAAQTIGCVYTLSGIDGIDCEIYNAKERTTLHRAVQKNPSAFGLQEGEDFPVIIAFDSCAQDVSFQIHPTDTYAKEQLHLPYGKSEAWYFIEKPSGGWVYAENKAGHRTAVEAALQRKDFHGVIDHIPVSKHDLVYIRSGMMHALTAGSLIYEIQQSTNITYRLYDYERTDKHGNTRPLHVKEALANLDSSLHVQKQSFPKGTSFDQREFSLQHRTLSGSYTNTYSIASVISVVSGSLLVDTFPVSQGISILVMPEECIQLTGSAECIIAAAHPYWRV
ncbi:class I mannose-6-phosphate isomerase [[Clostridium] innocuum]|nr:class I mannose-6-phosphate isomerase [[Clostridium] innocuum]